LIGGARAAAPKPNIVFILADDLRWDAMSCAGHPLLKTPHLDRLARDGGCIRHGILSGKAGATQ
jgi:N-acetylglucosamine-6-sulfatase